MSGERQSPSTSTEDEGLKIFQPVVVVPESYIKSKVGHLKPKDDTPLSFTELKEAVVSSRTVSVHVIMRLGCDVNMELWVPDSMSRATIVAWWLNSAQYI